MRKGWEFGATRQSSKMDYQEGYETAGDSERSALRCEQLGVHHMPRLTDLEPAAW